MNNNTQILIDFIKTLDRFKIVENIDGHYEHIGATLVDGILQSGVRYETVVKPRVVSVLANYPNHTTTSSFHALCEKEGIKNIISWKNDRKPNLIMLLLSLLQTEKIETCQQFSLWLDQEQNIQKLESINGIGPKTIDYFKILLGKETVAVDIHLKRFVQMAGIEISKYDEIKSVITEAANYLKISPSLLDHSIWEFMKEKKYMKLTKSDFSLFLDAPRHLWAEKHDLIDKTQSQFEINVMKQGYEVEALAKEYLEKFVLKRDDNLISQKSFTDRQFTVRTDFLIHKPYSDTYGLYEVKSGTSVKKENIYDVTYQFLVISEQIKIDRVFILHLNSEYLRYSTLNLAELFVAEDVTQKVLELEHEVYKLRDIALKIALKPSQEGIQPCLTPKCCPCPDICYPDLPEISIFDIPRLSKKKKSELLNLGIFDIKDVPKSFSLNSIQHQIVDVVQSNQEFINREAIQKEFQHFTFPLYFLDYESYLSAIPLFDGYKPQQQMVFQYSLHKMEALNRDIHHTEHLTITKDDPSKSLVKQLWEDIGDIGTVFVWCKPFEKTRNKELAIIHPEYAGFLEDLNERIYDLGDFFNFGFYLHPEFKGSWSIKNVLPVMVPELSYEEMEIGKGDEAMMAWWELIHNKLPIEEAKKTKTALLEYCKLDTMAMVKIYKKLYSMIS